MNYYLLYIVLYFVVLFGVGLYYLRRVKTADEYLLAGRSMGFWPMVGTIISTWCGASVFIGSVGMGNSVGLSGFFKFTFPGAIVSILFACFFSVPIRRQGFYTLADLFFERFGKSAGILPALLSTFGYAIPTVAMQMTGMATIWKMIFKLDTKEGLILSFLLITAFTILGGLPATIITDALQAIIIILGLVVLLFNSFSNAGGVAEVIKNTPSEYFSPMGPYGLSEVLLYALSVAPFYMVWQSTWQRISAAKNEKIARTSSITGFAIAMVISVIPFLIGIATRNFVPDGIEGDTIFSYVTYELLRPPVGAIIYTALLSALVTTGDSIILQGSSSLTEDIYHRFVLPDAPEQKLMSISRISVVIIAVLSFVLSLQEIAIISIYQWALRLLGTALVFPFFAAMFWKRATKAGVVSSMLLTTITNIMWPYLHIGFNQTVAGFLISGVMLIAVSLLTKHSDDEKIVAIYWETLSD